MNYVFLLLKNSIRGLKNVVSDQLLVHFRWNFRPKIFIAPKDSFLNFRGSLLGNFWAIVLISAVMSILEDFWQSTASSLRSC